MSIKYKSALVLFLFAALFVAAISGLFVYQSRMSILESSSRSLLASLKSDANHLNAFLREKITLAITASESTILRTRLVKSNRLYATLSENELETAINSLEAGWKQSGDSDTPMIQEYLYNPAASYLRELQTALPEEFGELFLTNRFGITVGATNRLTTITHRHKYWWRGAYNQGHGRIYVDDRGYDDSVGNYVLGIVVPIKVDRQTIGILKANIILTGSLRRFIRDIGSEDQRAALVRSSGLVVMDETGKPLGSEVPERVKERFREQEIGVELLEVEEHTELVAFAKVPFAYGNREILFGGAPISAGHSLGAAQGDSWHLVMFDDMTSPLAVSDQITRWIIQIGLLFAALIAVLSLLLGGRITRPLLELTREVKSTTSGRLDRRVPMDAPDEIGALAAEFNQMLGNLQETMVSKKALETEVVNRRRLEEQLKEISITDELTGLYNRRGFMTLAEKQLRVADRTKNRPILAFIDLDDLKKINDEFGHEKGDQAIRDIARILKALFRGSDTIGRLGGDEFAILMVEESEIDNIDAVSKRLASSVNEFNLTQDASYRLSASMGMVTYDSENPQALDRLIADADKLMYQNKKEKRS